MERNMIIKATRELMRTNYGDDIKLCEKDVNITLDYESLKESFLQACESIPKELEKYIPNSVSMVYNELVGEEVKQEEAKIAKVGAPELKTIPVKETEKVEVKKPEKKIVPVSIVTDTFSKLIANIQKNKDKKMTSFIDSLLLVPISLITLQKAVQEESDKRASKTFKTMGEINAYFKYVIDKKKYILVNQNGTVQLTGVINE